MRARGERSYWTNPSSLERTQVYEQMKHILSMIYCALTADCSNTSTQASSVSHSKLTVQSDVLRSTNRGPSVTFKQHFRGRQRRITKLYTNIGRAAGTDEIDARFPKVHAIAWRCAVHILDDHIEPLGVNLWRRRNAKVFHCRMQSVRYVNLERYHSKFRMISIEKNKLHSFQSLASSDWQMWERWGGRYLSRRK